MSRRHVGLWAAAASAQLLLTPSAWATSGQLFGFGPQSSSVAQADIASAHPASAAFVNPAAASEPGTRIQLTYGHGWSNLRFGSESAPVRDIAGTDLGVQFGHRWNNWSAGGALALHLPDKTLARVAFVPGTEPLFVRYEPASQRASGDVVAAVGYGPLQLGAGVSALVNAKGNVDFLLGQDGNGTYADGNADITLPYHLAPIAGAQLNFEAFAAALRYRGAHSIDLDLSTQADVHVTGNPLNGTTTVSIRGVSGYVPATWDLGVRLQLAKGWQALGSLELARWSQAPSPAAELSIDVRLGLIPGQLETQFVHPRFRDTLSPRLGLQVQASKKATARLGYAYWPSPVPKQTGFTSYADAPVHVLAGGLGWDLGRLWGVGLRADAALQLLLLEKRAFDKPSQALPFAHYSASGNVLYASAALEASWR